MDETELAAARHIIEEILAQGERKPPTVRGQRAQCKLKRAALEILNEKGYRKANISDVTRRAGVASGLFYHYYTDMRTLCVSLIIEFIDALDATESIEKDVASGDWFGRIKSHYISEIDCYANNPGLIQCTSQLGEELPAITLLWRESRHQRAEQLVHQIDRLFPKAGISRRDTRLLVHLLSSLGVSTLTEYYIERCSPLLAFGLSSDEMAEWMSALFYRGLFLKNPAPQHLSHSRILALIDHSQL